MYHEKDRKCCMMLSSVGVRRSDTEISSDERSIGVCVYLFWFASCPDTDIYFNSNSALSHFVYTDGSKQTNNYFEKCHPIRGQVKRE